MSALGALDPVYAVMIADVWRLAGVDFSALSQHRDDFDSQVEIP